MAIELSPLQNEISKVLSGPYTYNKRRWQALIHLMDADLTVIPVRVMSVHTQRDYTNNYTDILMIEVAIPVGTYTDIFYPNKLNLEVTLNSLPMNPVKGGPPRSFRYKATAVDTGQPRVSSPDMNGASTQILDLTEVILVELQLTPMSIYTLRTASTGVIFRQEKPEDCLKTLITSEIGKIQVEEAQRILGVDMVPADNQEVKEQMVVPHGTMLYDTPDTFQKHICGLYNNGLSHYIQDNHWYIYPTFDMSRVNQSDRMITIISIPEKKYPSIEKTYRQTGEHQFTILATAKGKYSNPVKEVTMNEGTGLRFMNAQTLMSWDETKPEQNKVNMQKDKMVSEITAITPSDNVTFSPMSDNRITANNFAERSKIAGRTGAYLSWMWENSYPDAIIPGMYVRVLYLTVDGQVNEIKGIILKAEHFEHLRYQSMVEENYITNTALFIWCENDLLEQAQKTPIRSQGVIGEQPLFPFSRD